MTQSDFQLKGSKSTAKGLLILFLILILLQLILFMIVHFIVQMEDIRVGDSTIIFFYYGVPFFSLAAVISGYILFCKRKQLAYKAELDSDKLLLYKSAMTLKYAFFELASIFILIAYYLTHHGPYILFYFIIISIFLMNFPTNKKLLNELDPENPAQIKGCGPVKD